MSWLHLPPLFGCRTHLLLGSCSCAAHVSPAPPPSPAVHRRQPALPPHRRAPPDPDRRLGHPHRGNPHRRGRHGRHSRPHGLSAGPPQSSLRRRRRLQGRRCGCRVTPPSTPPREQNLQRKTHSTRDMPATPRAIVSSSCPIATVTLCAPTRAPALACTLCLGPHSSIPVLSALSVCLILRSPCLPNACAMPAIPPPITSLPFPTLSPAIRPLAVPTSPAIPQRSPPVPCA